MATSIKDLLRYKVEVDLKNLNGEVLKKVWIRIIGDEDLDEAGKFARVASFEMRKKLKDTDSLDYKDRIYPMVELTRDEQEQLIKQSKLSDFTSEAYIKINRDELITISEIAELPDAPTLEEQEILDKKLQEQRLNFEKRIDEYVETRATELDAELKEKSDDEILEISRRAMANVLPLQTFLNELNAQKLFRATYEDEGCKKRAFESVEDFKASHDVIKLQLITAYSNLELNGSEIKN